MKSKTLQSNEKEKVKNKYFVKKTEKLNYSLLLARQNHTQSNRRSYDYEENISPHNLSLLHFCHSVPYTTESPSSSSAKHRPSCS